ncbi:Major facilitator superfamily domain-containing protein 6 [Operophtera brumata]|uniref:Major facilitator superfamily domain-containing protein 6 n=1 Tax=Operophtera brumata TaxID=104452 RepID=A0A0L7LLN6_OPEBR|nr:Major facilitator superfamily domain-containing protein 6 [Operophtera brumata]
MKYSKIIKRWGYGTTLTLSLLCYGVRMALISTIQQPWHLVFIEGYLHTGLLTHRATYYGTTLTLSLLCYGVRMALISTIQHPWHLVFIEGYLLRHHADAVLAVLRSAHGADLDHPAAVAPRLHRGFAIGSLLGGQLYSRVGGRSAFRLFAGAAAAASLLHAALFALTARSDGKKPEESIRESDEAEDMLPDKHAICRTDAPSAGQMRHLPDSLAVYRDTVLPLKEAS